MHLFLFFFHLVFGGPFWNLCEMCSRPIVFLFFPWNSVLLGQITSELTYCIITERVHANWTFSLPWTTIQFLERFTVINLECQMWMLTFSKEKTGEWWLHNRFIDYISFHTFLASLSVTNSSDWNNSFSSLHSSYSPLLLRAANDTWHGTIIHVNSA